MIAEIWQKNKPFGRKDSSKEYEKNNKSGSKRGVGARSMLCLRMTFPKKKFKWPDTLPHNHEESFLPYIAKG